MCVHVGLRGLGISPEGNGITSCLHNISTCQPAEAEERSDGLWRLASTPTSADARHTCMNAPHTHSSRKTYLSGHMLCCTKAYKYAITDSHSCHTNTYIKTHTLFFFGMKTFTCTQSWGWVSFKNIKIPVLKAGKFK